MEANDIFASHHAGLNTGELRFPKCGVCLRFHWYPMPRCVYCFSSKWEWQAVAPEASVYSWTIVRRAFSKEFDAHLPYTVALLDIRDAPGVRLIGNVVDVAPEHLSFGLRVRACFDRRDWPAPVCFVPA